LLMNAPFEISEALQAAAPSAAEPSFHKDLVDNLFDGVYLVDLKRTITYWNNGAKRLTGYLEKEAVGRSCFDNFLMHVDDKGYNLCGENCPLMRTMQDGQPREAEISLRHKSGYLVPISVRAAPIHDDAGRITGAVEIFTDITSKKHIERRAGELEGIAYLDSLTGIFNRRMMELKVKQVLQEVQQFNSGMGLIILDIDNFKLVNDTWGHEAGDHVLRSVTRTLSGCVRPTDLVGRWGGEEFLLILSNMQPSQVELGKIAERCRGKIAASEVPLAHDAIQVSTSLGATLLLSTDSSDTALKRADELLYRSKNSGRNQCSIG
jgi:diguanylate cyclase (GGDEF)-like protein/PAS domain S-box-containing protein